MDFTGMSREQIEGVIASAEAALSRLTEVWEVETRRAWAVGELERLAAHAGTVPASPVPVGGFMPGQVVEIDGTLYVNGSGTYLDYPPGEEPISEWVAVETPPEPSEPEPEPIPEPTTPPEWSPTGTYHPGDTVTKDGTVYECLIGHGPERLGTWAPGTAPTIWKAHP